MLDIKAEMEKISARFSEIQQLRIEKVKEIKKPDEEALQLRGAFSVYQKVLKDQEDERNSGPQIVK